MLLTHVSQMLLYCNVSFIGTDDQNTNYRRYTFVKQAGSTCKWACCVLDTAICVDIMPMEKESCAADTYSLSSSYPKTVGGHLL